MCGRFTLRAPASVIAEQFALYEVEPFSPRFNIAPTQPVAVVRAGRASAKQTNRDLAWLRWGLVPRWAKDLSIGNRMINARAESVMDKPAYRSAYRERRCLIVADGFYEWKKEGRAKQPYFLRLRDERPFAFAGLWETWKSPDDALVESCVLLTTDPNPLVAEIHDRMPLILQPDDYDRWLDPALRETESLRALFRPYAGEEMVAFPVAAYVNSPTHDDPRCIEPLTQDGRLFAT